MENVANSLKELGEEIGFDIVLDADGTCTLELADGRPLVIQERADLDELDFVSILGEVPDAARAEVFTFSPRTSTGTERSAPPSPGTPDSNRS